MPFLYSPSLFSANQGPPDPRRLQFARGMKLANAPGGRADAVISMGGTVYHVNAPMGIVQEPSDRDNGSGVTNNAFRRVDIPQSIRYDERSKDSFGNPVFFANAEPAFHPTDLSGLALWLSPDTGVTLNGGKVSRWTDIVNSANSYAQETGSSQPDYVTGSVGDQPYLSFDGVDDYLSSSFRLSGPKTVFIVRKLANVTFESAARTVWIISGSSPDLPGMSGLLHIGLAGYASSTFHDDSLGSHSSFGVDGPLEKTSWHIEESVYDGVSSGSLSSYAHIIDGDNKSVATSGVVTLRKGTMLGARGDPLVQFFTGSMKDFIVFSASLSADDRQMVRQWLSERHAIPISS